MNHGSNLRSLLVLELRLHITLDPIYAMTLGSKNPEIERL
jgi:hypothetical protein